MSKASLAYQRLSHALARVRTEKGNHRFLPKTEQPREGNELYIPRTIGCVTVCQSNFPSTQTIAQ